MYKLRCNINQMGGRTIESVVNITKRWGKLPSNKHHGNGKTYKPQCLARPGLFTVPCFAVHEREGRICKPVIFT